MKKKNSRIKVGVSCGDLNGIGLEIILKTFEDNRISDLCTPIIYASKGAIQHLCKKLGIQNFSANYTNSAEEINGKKTTVVNVWKEKVEFKFGAVSKESGKYAFASLQAAVEDLKSGAINALVTAPINKEAIQSDEFNFPGHTEYLENEDEENESLMIMISDEAKIGVATGHIPLKEVPSQLNTDLILKKIKLLNQSLKKDFGISKPKIAIMGLNPHAGENGMLGKEEIEIIEPAIKQAKSVEILAFGPYPADGFFASGQHLHVDGILAMYHDQGLIPSKLFSRGQGINFTSGLSFVRTSPDHGTAFEIAGKGEANESSFRAALYQAIDIVKQRNLTEELESNQLVINKARN